MASSTQILRKMVLGNDSASRMAFRMSGGSDNGIETTLSNPAKLTLILRNVLRMSINEIERVVSAESTPGHTTPTPTGAEIETIKMENFAANTGKY